MLEARFGADRGLVAGVIYLDANATTRPLPQVVSAVRDAMVDGPANPASVHHAGDRARRVLGKARDNVCLLIDGADPDGIVFTSGGTEGNNAVLRAAVAAAPEITVITSTAEHASVMEPASIARRHVRVPVMADGRVDPAALVDALPEDDGRPLVSLAWVNSETGVIQPVEAIGEAVRAQRPDAIIHLDAAQAVGRLPLHLASCDVLTFSGHKLHGPAGTGVLALADPDEDRLPPFILGGGQERGRRSGTPNVAGAVGLGVAAAERAGQLREAMEALGAMRDAFEHAVLSRLDGAWVNGAAAPRVPNTTNIRFAGIDAMALVARLDQKGIACSFGSACSSARPGPSPTLLAMGLSEAEAASSVRFSFSVLNTMDEAREAAACVFETVEAMR
jgi:cysteine desulfurase